MAGVHARLRALSPIARPSGPARTSHVPTVRGLTLAAGALRWGRGLSWGLVAGLVGLTATTLGRLPPVVATHFDAQGAPNGWSSRAAYAALILAVGVGLPLAIVLLVHVLTSEGPQGLSIPGRDYWRRPEHAAEAVRRVRAYMWWLGCIMGGTSVAVHSLIVRAHAMQPPRLSAPAIVILLGAVAASIAAWSAGWWRLLRPPR